MYSRLCANTEMKHALLKLHIRSFQIQSCVDSSTDEVLGCTVAMTSDTVLEHHVGLQSTRSSQLSSQRIRTSLADHLMCVVFHHKSTSNSVGTKYKWFLL